MPSARTRRNQSIRSRLRRIVLAPTAALVVLWLIVSCYLGYNAALQYAVSRGSYEILVPAAHALVAVMDERSATIAYIEAPAETGDDLNRARETSDAFMTDVLGKFEGVLPLSPEPVQQRITDLDEQFGAISDLRLRVDDGQASRAEVLEFYNGLITSGADLFDEQSRSVPAAAAVGPAITATYTFRALDLFAQADAQLSQAFATGELSREDQQEFIRLYGAYREQVQTVEKYLSPEHETAVSDMWEDPDYVRLTELANVIASREVTSTTDPFTGASDEDLSMPVGEQEWRGAYAPVMRDYTEVGTDEAIASAGIQEGFANQSVLVAVLGSLGVAAATVLALMISTRSSQQLVGRLSDLREGTQELADRRLPALIDRLGRNEPVDLHTEVPDLDVANDEIGEV
ncbi:nitrate- and nitrite sensing domain-containing protein, partial [Nocardiopsis ansamitocini]|uniref:nitrate- and nitrite sensing domain-containing protein n=1 Tax=Nocardiopsis ansamitocini TaxID=1670832 RepID=UPI0025526E12